ncbi:MAG: hypothetical protein K2X66_05615 [Cyanobacteria bacterium]|nr:hypothetical protein [Cyanobacteriota bacterium]
MTESPENLDGENLDIENIQESGYKVSFWPIFALNVMGLALILLACLPVVFSEEALTWESGKEIIVGYFSGIGCLSAIAISYVTWISGPVVFIRPEGLQLEGSWLMDKTFPQNQTFAIDWHQIGKVQKRWFWTMGYLILYSKEPNTPPFILPWFLANQKTFQVEINPYLPQEHPLRPFLSKS